MLKRILVAFLYFVAALMVVCVGVGIAVVLYNGQPELANAIGVGSAIAAMLMTVVAILYGTGLAGD